MKYKTVKTISAVLFASTLSLTGTLSGGLPAFAQEEPEPETVIVDEFDDTNPEETIDELAVIEESEENVELEEADVPEESSETTFEDTMPADYSEMNDEESVVHEEVDTYIEEPVMEEMTEENVMAIAEEDEEETPKTLQETINESEGETGIDLSEFGEMQVYTAEVVIPAGKTITLTSSSAVTLSTDNTSKYVFVVEEGGSLTLDGMITILNSPAVRTNGNLVIENAEIKDSPVKYSTGAVKAEGGNATVTINGGSITGTKVTGASGALYLKDGAKGYMNGGSISSTTVRASYAGSVKVQDAYFEMNGGSLTNGNAANMILSSPGVFVYAEKGTSDFVMNAGEILGNTGCTGGGVYVCGGTAVYGDKEDMNVKASFTMNGGLISGNSAYVSGTSGGAGGGVYLESNAQFTLNNGMIAGNTANHGGGVSTCNPKPGANDVRNGLSFKMYGGTISGNRAVSYSGGGESGSGGGIFVYSTGVNLYGGTISENEAERLGGGIYVTYYSTGYLYNALITENHATSLGGGMWFCPAGTFTAADFEGIADYGNTADGAGDDFVTVPSYFGRSRNVTVSDRMLGAGKANWHKDGAVISYGSIGTSDPDTPRYSEPGEEVEGIRYSKEVYALKALPTQEGKDSALAHAGLYITNNTATRGGGTGSNGTLMAGRSYEGSVSVEVDKTWDTRGEDVAIPESITVYLVADGRRVDSMELRAEDGWKGTFSSLSTKLKYTIEEEVPSGWSVVSDVRQSVSGDYTASLTNTINKGKVTFEKQDENQAGLSGAKIVLEDEEGNILARFTTDGEPMEFELLPGKYLFREEEAPKGYAEAESIAFTVDPLGNVVLENEIVDKITMIDEYSTHTVKFSKQDILGEELAGASIELKDADGNVVEAWVSDGTAKELEVLPGTYTFTETAAPEGYLIATDITIVVGIDGSVMSENVTVTGDDENVIIMIDDLEPLEGVEPEQDIPDTPEESETPEPTPTPVPNTPKTGVSVDTGVWGMLAMSMSMFAGLFLIRRRYNK